MHGKPALPADFSQMPYANQDAPKGGRLVQGILGTFDSLNPFIVRGAAVQPIRGFVVESLMARGNDEPFTLYGLWLTASKPTTREPTSTFHLNPPRRFYDGSPFVPKTCCSWQLLGTRAALIIASIIRRSRRPSDRRQYGSFRFSVKQRSRIAADPRPDADFAETRYRRCDFRATSMTAPLGSGPYRVTSVEAWSQRHTDTQRGLWGRDLPVNRGLWNFDEIRFDFYREANSQFEAFKRGLYDFRVETEPLRWHDGYNFPAAGNGQLVRETNKTGLPAPSEFLVFNTRHQIFSDIRVREALTLLFDFEWINRNYFFGLYNRAGGFFVVRSCRPTHALPTKGSASLLKPFPSLCGTDILDGTYRLPANDGSGRDRKAFRAALALLSQAGYESTERFA